MPTDPLANTAAPFQPRPDSLSRAVRVDAQQPPSRLGDFAIALLLWVGSVALVVATNDMGFVRDEAFYFETSERYQDWFVQVEKGGEERKAALTRSGIHEIWRSNAEHPPLNKVLFGWSWRILGRKLRPVEGITDQDGFGQLNIGGLGPAHGYAVGAPVELLRPQLVGDDPTPNGRRLAVGEVLERLPSRAVVRLTGGVDLKKLRGLCQEAGPDADGKTVRRTGCEVVERRATQLLSESAAMRFPGAVFAGLLVALIYLSGRLFFAGRLTAMGRGRLERPFALLAALGYLALPQPFWHAHLCTFDTTIAALLMLTAVAWHRALFSRPWVWIASVAWGLALLAKHNALFLPVPLLVVWGWSALAERKVAVHVDLGKRQLLQLGLLALGCLGIGALLNPLAGVALAFVAIASPRLRLELPPVPGVFVAMLAIGPALLVLGWPLLWVDTLDNLLRWIEFHLHHDHYMQVYFGKVLANPPFPAEFPWMMTILTWPLTLLAALALGLFAVYGPLRRLRLRLPVTALDRRDGWLFAEQQDKDGTTPELRSWDRLMLVSALWPMALISMPGTPVFGGTKHWMPAFPFLLLIGARGVQALWRRLALGKAAARADDPSLLSVLQPGPLARLGAWVLVALLLAPAAQATAATYRHGSAYYNELIGGIPGAAEAGMQRQFWGGSTRDGLEWVNRHAPANASVWFHKCAWWAFLMYQREGWFRRDLRYSAGPEGTAMGFYHHQKDHDDYEVEAMRDYGTRAPVFQSSLDGVPILSVYQRAGLQVPASAPVPAPMPAPVRAPVPAPAAAPVPAAVPTPAAAPARN